MAYRLGIRELDKSVEVKKGDLIMIAGGISSGKSSMAVNICADMAEDNPIFFLSLKMKDYLFFKKLHNVLGLYRDGSRIIKSLKLKVDKRLDNIHVHFNHCAYTQDIRNEAIELKKEHGGLAIVIDGLWDVHDKEFNNWGHDFDPVKCSQFLKSLALETDAPIIVTSYIEYDEHPSQVKPLLSDLTGGEDVAKPFDTIIALWGGDTIGEVRITKTLIMKGRKCVGDESLLVFDAARSVFRTIQDYDVDRMNKNKTHSPVEKKLYQTLSPSTQALMIPQFPIGNYRADFAIPSKKLVIEVDGHDYHSSPEQKLHDSKRDRFMTSQGWRVLRFTGREVYRDVDAVVSEIESMITQ